MIFTVGTEGRIHELTEYYNPITTATYFGLVEVTPVVPDFSRARRAWGALPVHLSQDLPDQP